jgi:hypothetical protein
LIVKNNFDWKKKVQFYFRIQRVNKEKMKGAFVVLLIVGSALANPKKYSYSKTTILRAEKKFKIFSNSFNSSSPRG